MHRRDRASVNSSSTPPECGGLRTFRWLLRLRLLIQKAKQDQCSLVRSVFGFARVWALCQRVLLTEIVTTKSDGSLPAGPKRRASSSSMCGHFFYYITATLWQILDSPQTTVGGNMRQIKPPLSILNMNQGYLKWFFQCPADENIFYNFSFLSRLTQKRIFSRGYELSSPPTNRPRCL